MRYLILLAVMVTLPGCATIMSGRSDSVAIDSIPQGASVILDGAPVGQTPCQVTISRKWYAGYIEFKSGDNAVGRWCPRSFDPWFLGNYLIDPIVSPLVDLISGSVRGASASYLCVNLETGEMFILTPEQERQKKIAQEKQKKRIRTPEDEAASWNAWKARQQRLWKTSD